MAKSSLATSLMASFSQVILNAILHLLPRLKCSPEASSLPDQKIPPSTIATLNYRDFETNPLPNISFLRRLVASSASPAAMSAAKTKAQGIIDDNAVGMLISHLDPNLLVLMIVSCSCV